MIHPRSEVADRSRGECRPSPRGANAHTREGSSRPLPDHRLEHLPDARLVAYIGEMHASGHTPAARRAQQVFAWRHRDRLSAYVRARAPREEVDDTLARILLAAGRSSFRQRTVGQCFAWLFAIAHNQVVDFYRGRGRRLDTVALEIDDDAEGSSRNEPWVEDETDAAVLRLELDRFLSRLRSDHELAVRLGLVDADMSAAQVARTVGMTESNVYQTISRFRKNFRQHLRGEG